MTDASFRPARARLTDQVAAEIKKRIISGAYDPGSRLPPADVLAAELGITRLTLREALQSTEAAGFTRSRQGDGTLVCDPFGQGTLGLLGEILSLGHDLTEAEVRSLLEFRSIVTLGFAPLLARNASADHVARMRAIVAREREVRDDLQALLDLDATFNEVLAAATGNVIYALLARSVRPAYLYLSRIVFRAAEDHGAIIDAHEQITRAAEARDASAVGAALAAFVACGNTIIEQAIRGGAFARPTGRSKERSM